MQTSLAKPPLAPIFGRIGFLLLVLSLTAFIASTWFSKGISWVYDLERNYSPLLTCPRFILNAAGMYPNGPVCRMALHYTPELESSITQAGLLAAQPNVKAMGICSLSSVNSPEYINCYWDTQCDNLCTVESTNGRCPDHDGLMDPARATNPASIPQCLVVIGSVGAVEMPCYYVTVDSYCDNQFQVTPSNEIAIRGILIATIIIVGIWTVAEFVLRSVDIGLKQELAAGKAEQDKSLPDKVRILRALVEERWAVEASGTPPGDSNSFDDGFSVRTPMSTIAHPLASSRQYGSGQESTPRDLPTSGFSSPLQTGFYNSRKRGMQCRDPRVRFSSNAWRRRLRQYQTLRADKKSQFKSREFVRSLFLYALYFGLIVVTLFVVITVSPQHISVSVSDAGGSIVNVFIGQISLWEVHSVLDVVVFADILLDFGLFLIAAVCVQWPRAPVFSRHLQRKLDEFVADEERQDKLYKDEVLSENSLMSSAGLEGATGSSLSSQDTRSLSFVLKQSVAFDCCLMIACHESTMTREKSETFSNTLRAAMLIFPPSHIFICDNGNSISPADDTQIVAQSVHPDINYLYVPEGNKTFAFYWCNRYWIPSLVRAGRVANFTYALIIDDDVPLPADLHIPHEHLRQHPEIKAVHFPITAATPDGAPSLLVRCQDMEYKLAAVHKQFQSLMSRCMSCHGAIALWERKAMEEVFYMHDTVFHGEDMYMGLCLLRKRDQSRIISAAQSIVPTYAPPTFAILFRQRVKSWELTSHRKTLTYVKELINPRSFCHVPSLVLKPYFLQEVITILLDWLRVYLLCGLFLRDWLGLLVMTSLFTSLMYVQVFLFSVLVLRSRKELRPSVFTMLTFPFYRLCGLVFRICALCHNLLVYSHDRSSVKIGKREDEIRDIPPTPPSHIVDWFSVWANAPKLTV